MQTFVYLRQIAQPEDTDSQRLRLLAATSQSPLGSLTVTVIADDGVAELPWHERRLGRLLFEQAEPGDRLLVAEVTDLGASLADVYAFLASAAELRVAVHVAEGSLTLAPGCGTEALQAATLRLAASVSSEFLRGRTRAGLLRAAAHGRSGGRRKGSTGRLKLDDQSAAVAALLEQGTSVPKIAAHFGVTVKTLRRFLARRFPPAP